MKHLLEYIICESITGVSLNIEKNIQAAVNYFKKYFPNTKTIISDNGSANMFSELSEWILDNNSMDGMFLIKNNKNHDLVLFNNVVSEMSDDELADYGIKFIGSRFYSVDGFTTKIGATEKNIEKSQKYTKIWSSKWNITYGKAFEKYNNEINFGNIGCYILKNDPEKIQHDIYEELTSQGLDDIAAVFMDGDIEDNVKNIPSDVYKDNIANVLSEPLSILYILNNKQHLQDNIRNEFSDIELGEISHIVIPIKQNWPVADFYVEFENQLGILIPISVKSGENGNTSSVIRSLSLDDEYDKHYINKDDIKDAALAMFNEIIPQFNTNRAQLHLSDIPNIELLSVYALNMLEFFVMDNKIKNGEKLIKTFKQLIDLIKDSKIYNVLNKICELNGTNNVEKILVCLFKKSNDVMKRIENCVEKLMMCHKITFSKDKQGEVKYKYFKNINGNFNLINKSGGTSLSLKFDDNNNVIDVSVSYVTKQGQWIGYTF